MKTTSLVSVIKTSKKLTLVPTLLLSTFILSGCKQQNGGATDYYQQGLELIESKSYTAALESLQQASEQTPENSQIYLKIAEIYDLKGLYEKAEETLDVGVENSKDDAELYFQKGEILLKQKKYDEAITAYDKAIKENYDEDTPLFKKGQIQIKQSKFDAAKKSFEGVSLPTDLKKQSYYYLAVLTTNDLDRSLEYLKKVKDTENETLKQNATTLETVFSEEKTKSQGEDVNENYLKLLHGYGLIKVEEFEVAKSVIEPVANYYEEQGKPSYQANFYMGSIYYNLGDYDNALTELNTSIVTNPTDATTLHLLGLVYTKKSNQAKSQEYFEKAIKLEPNNEYIRYDYINTLQKFNINSTAEKQYEELIKLETDKQPQYRLEFAQFLNDEVGNPAKALTQTNYLLTEWSGFGNSTATTKAEVYDTHGWSLYLSDKNDDALDYLKKAIESDEFYARAYYHLGKVYEKDENLGKAIDNYAKAIDLALDEELSTKAYQDFDRLNQ